MVIFQRDGDKFVAVFPKAFVNGRLKPLSRKRPAARSFLVPLGGRTRHAVGLGALSN
ncbi:MAG: hypothetical protein V4540_01495 [Pseudomonadota bacterium]